MMHDQLVTVFWMVVLKFWEVSSKLGENGKRRLAKEGARKIQLDYNLVISTKQLL